ncbi:Hypothetical protein MVR_LOCUS36 [uncultured virus]|nr:Hypothetical protein MVR_LOCUS36 [uncultured virus]
MTLKDIVGKSANMAERLAMSDANALCNQHSAAINMGNAKDASDVQDARQVNVTILARWSIMMFADVVDQAFDEPIVIGIVRQWKCCSDVLGKLADAPRLKKRLVCSNEVVELVAC